MSSASLAVAPREHLDSARIASISVAIALNLAVILIASRPLTPIRLSIAQPDAPPPTIRIIEPEVMPPPPPPPAALIPIPHTPPVVPTHVVAPALTRPPAVVPTSEGRTVAPPITAPTRAPSQPMPVAPVAAAPVEASLAYRSSPLRYPTRALQQRMHGTVLLRVLVDETGKPVKVSVEQGSGYAVLDHSAIEQVMAGWRFQPALVDGHAVRAWARVPVSFELH